MNSTLGSVVPLAMFISLKHWARAFLLYIKMRGCNTNYLSSNNSTERSSTWYSSIDETFINNLCEMSAIKLLPSSYSIRLVPAWLQTEAQSTGRRQKSTPFPLVSGLSTIHLGSLHVYLSGVSTINLPLHK